MHIILRKADRKKETMQPSEGISPKPQRNVPVIKVTKTYRPQV